MTEYDFSEEGYQKYLEKQKWCSDWARDAEAHAPEYKAPFGLRSEYEADISKPSFYRRSSSVSPPRSAVQRAPTPYYQDRHRPPSYAAVPGPMPMSLNKGAPLTRRSRSHDSLRSPSRSQYHKSDRPTRRTSQGIGAPSYYQPQAPGLSPVASSPQPTVSFQSPTYTNPYPYYQYPYGYAQPGVPQQQQRQQPTVVVLPKHTSVKVMASGWSMQAQPPSNMMTSPTYSINSSKHHATFLSRIFHGLSIGGGGSGTHSRTSSIGSRRAREQNRVVVGVDPQTQRRSKSHHHKHHDGHHTRRGRSPTLRHRKSWEY